MKTHPVINIKSVHGEIVEAQAPVIISASRATDIPAFYADWLFDRLDKGYLRWRNPFNGRYTYISFANTRFIVFWSKNPTPLIPYLCKLKEKGIKCYIQYSLNDYEAEALEPNVPNLQFRIEKFKELVNLLGKGSVVWRFDPLILSEIIDIDTLISKVKNVGDKLLGFTEKLVFSFADIGVYKNVSKNLKISGIRYREWDEHLMKKFAERLALLNIGNWNYELATCAEKIDLSEFGIVHNRCIDPELICRLTSDDAVLQNYLYSAKRDSGQRKHCGCILAKDIGAYNTCLHGCAYCYATRSKLQAIDNYKKTQANPLFRRCNMKSLTFDKILEDAVSWFNALSGSTQKQLKEDLEHGAASLQNNKQLKAYIAVYGKIHRDKLLQAFHNIPKTVWEEPHISIIDYGSGQGIAEMV